MRYDDRLATVLRLPTPGRNMARVQLTQLLDLLGAAPSEARGDLLDAAYLRVSALCTEFPDAEIAAMLGQPGLRLRSPRLVASQSQAAPAVARAALHAARLEEASWLDLIPALPPACWSMLWQRRDLTPGPRELLARLGGGRIALANAGGEAVASDDLGGEPPLAAPSGTAPMAPSPAPPVNLAEAPSLSVGGEPLAVATAPVDGASPAEAPAPLTDTEPKVATPPTAQLPADEGIGAIVRRIEAFRRTREAAQREGAAPLPYSQDAPRLPLGEEPGAPVAMAFDIETDCDGCVIRADAAIGPMVVGLWLGDIGEDNASEGGAGTTGAPAELIAHQQPIRAVATHLTGAPAISGAWQLDAIPQFDILGGRFVGYLGRLRRRAPVNAAALAPPSQPGESPASDGQPTDSHADRLRQALHELRTPVNAIQGFAEIIQQQLFGPTPHEYRALAAVIAADAARMLAGFEELERLARIDSGAMELTAGTSDLADCVCGTLARLERHTSAHNIALELDGIARPLTLALAPIETERLCWRLLATLVAVAGHGESLSLRLTRKAGLARMSVSLPAALVALIDGEGEAALFRAAVHPAQEGPSAGMFGTGFALRLARAEARVAGGGLTVERERDGATLCLYLPGLTQIDTGHSVEPRGKFP